MVEDQLNLILWWGKDASETDKKVWQQFQIEARHHFPNVAFIEVFLQEQYGREYERLANEGWQTQGRFGTGVWHRMMWWSKSIGNHK
jgi:hypothetical protein